MLDEIAGGLTEHEARELVEEIRRIKAQGVTMIWIEHVVHALLAVADRLFVINFGQKLAEGAPDAVMNDTEVKRVYMGTRSMSQGEVGGAMLTVHNLTAFYGDFQALFGIDFEVSHGEVVAVIGANGAGKSTFLRTVCGLLKAPREPSDSRTSRSVVLRPGRSFGAALRWCPKGGGCSPACRWRRTS